MVKFCRTVLNFGYDFVLLVHFFGDTLYTPMSRLVSVKVNYPPGLEAMVHSFKLCATARLFLQDLIPHVEAGIFLDNDIVVMDDLSLLWDKFDLFSSETAMAMAPVEPHYGAMVMVRDFAIFDLIL